MSEAGGNDAGMSRGDFLKGIGLGLGAAGMVSLAGGQSFAAEEKPIVTWWRSPTAGAIPTVPSWDCCEHSPRSTRGSARSMSG